MTCVLDASASLAFLQGEAGSAQAERVTQGDPAEAAQGWQDGAGLSLLARLCLALGVRFYAMVLTADRAWEGLPNVSMIHRRRSRGWFGSALGSSGRK